MSGELALAFSTANTVPLGQPSQQFEAPTAWNGALLDGLFQGVVEAVEEALVNCLVAAETLNLNNQIKGETQPAANVANTVLISVRRRSNIAATRRYASLNRPTQRMRSFTAPTG